MLLTFCSIPLRNTTNHETTKQYTRLHIYKHVGYISENCNCSLCVWVTDRTGIFQKWQPNPNGGGGVVKMLEIFVHRTSPSTKHNQKSYHRTRVQQKWCNAVLYLKPKLVGTPLSLSILTNFVTFLHPQQHTSDLPNINYSLIFTSTPEHSSMNTESNLSNTLIVCATLTPPMRLGYQLGNIVKNT
jgi:hypothetical protein